MIYCFRLYDIQSAIYDRIIFSIHFNSVPYKMLIYSKSVFTNMALQALTPMIDHPSLIRYIVVCSAGL